MVMLAGRVVCIHPSSRIARENLEVFCDTWAAHINDLSRLAKELDAAASGRIAAEKQAYMSLPRPGVSSSSSDTSSLLERVQKLNVVDVGVSVCDHFKQPTLSNSPPINNKSNSNTSTPSSSTSPHSSKTNPTSGYVSAETSSAFVPYKRQQLKEDQPTSTVYLNREEPSAPVIMRQKTSDAPLAEFDDDLLVEKKANQFENRMSLILDTLQNEADSLIALTNAKFAKLPQSSVKQA